MENNYPYEKLGLMYLGRQVKAESGVGLSDPFLLQNKTLTTHAAIIGMTGSGKTGLGIGLVEEAIMDDIPAILIDPKGDMGNLLLSFPDLSPKDFLPWIDPAEAQRKGMGVEEYATEMAARWEKGLGSWKQGKDRIAALSEKSDITIYTPGSSAGISVSVLDRLTAPSRELCGDTDTFNTLVDSAVTSLLALIDCPATESTSPEYVLLSSLFISFWRKGQDLNMEGLIGAIVNPPFDKIGVLPLTTYYPQDKRMDLAMRLNGVIASPSFSVWTSGAPLDIQNLLYDEEGKAKVAIFSIAHLDENKRMFFVTMLLNRIIEWMRRQQGSSSLRALLYMDEIFGYFPPTSNPPSKRPMLLLLKQARAYGLGVVLATQNPVDLDYKGLANIGTWFIGRLQTSQDRKRVIDGLAGSGGGLGSQKEIEHLLAALKSRQFLLRSAHLADLSLLESRWVMSYLKGPISLPDIERLMAERKKGEMREEKTTLPAHGEGARSESSHHHRPLLSDTIQEYFSLHPVAVERYSFSPFLVGEASVRFFNGKRNIDEVDEVCLRLPLEENSLELDWNEGQEGSLDESLLEENPPAESSYGSLPEWLMDARDIRQQERGFSDYLYQNKSLPLYRVPSLGLESDPGESLADFNVRIVSILREKKAEAIEDLSKKYKIKEERLEKKIAQAQRRIEKEEMDVSSKTTDTVLSFGSAVLGALFGRKTFSLSSLSKAGQGMKNAGRLSKEKRDVAHAEEILVGLQEDLQELMDALEEESLSIENEFAKDNHEVQDFAITPRRKDVFAVRLYLLWEMNLPI